MSQRTASTSVFAHEETSAIPRPVLQPALLDAPTVPLRRCGLDEVGRGALAGPLVAGAVILPDDIADRLGALSRFLRDSKTVPRARREDLAIAIRAHALALEVVSISVDDINQHGIGWANREAFRRLIAALDADEYIVDGRVRPPAPSDRIARVRCLVKADALVPAVAAASLVAKVHRDTMMAALHGSYPAYGWNTNAGYGAATHLAALRVTGACPEHRTLFVATALSGGQRARKASKASKHDMEPARLLE
ncbi:MAG TPA: ribonuclease HII [Ktedonobacterales bacterium]|nr:ribonuclease HII [Ktedonobacterales bacterium]